MELTRLAPVLTPSLPRALEHPRAGLPALFPHPYVPREVTLPRVDCPLNGLRAPRLVLNQELPSALGQARESPKLLLRHPQRGRFQYLPPCGIRHRHGPRKFCLGRRYRLQARNHFIRRHAPTGRINRRVNARRNRGRLGHRLRFLAILPLPSRYNSPNPWRFLPTFHACTLGHKACQVNAHGESTQNYSLLSP